MDAPKFICPSPKVWDFDEERLHWASALRVPYDPKKLSLEADLSGVRLKNSSTKGGPPQIKSTKSKIHQPKRGSASRENLYRSYDMYLEFS